MHMRWNAAHRPMPETPVSEIYAVLDGYDRDMRRTLNEEQVTDLGIAHHLAFAQMLAGAATLQNWAVVVCSLNIAVVLADRGLGQEHLPRFIEALKGANRAKRRGDKTGRYGFDGPAIQAIQDAFDVHEEQIKIARKDELVAAVQEVHRRADAGIAYQDDE
jgi:hypothetical protein